MGTRLRAILGSALFLLVAPGIVAGLVPWGITAWALDTPFAGYSPLRILGVAFIAAGLPVLLEAFARFALQGISTPAPMAPTQRLVVQGSFLYVRNPMYLAVLSLVVGQALLFASLGLAVYAALLALAFHAFVLAYEEPRLRRTSIARACGAGCRAPAPGAGIGLDARLAFGRAWVQMRCDLCVGWSAMRRFACIAAIVFLITAAPLAAQDRIDWTKVPLPAIDGTAHAPALFQNKVVLLVNTASFCGYTGQYEDLQKLWRRYREKGFVILGVAANDFGAQEPGSNEKIKAFCEANYGVDFPLLEKQTVVGTNAHPLYKWAAARTGPAGVPRWNFHKLLIGRDGALIAWFSTQTPPLDAKITGAVEKALAPPAN